MHYHLPIKIATTWTPILYAWTHPYAANPSNHVISGVILDWMIDANFHPLRMLAVLLIFFLFLLGGFCLISISIGQIRISIRLVIQLCLNLKCE